MPGLGAEDFSETVIGLLADGKKNFLLNLSLLELIYSSGIGTLIRWFTSIRRAGGHLNCSNQHGLCNGRLRSQV